MNDCLSKRSISKSIFLSFFLGIAFLRGICVLFNIFNDLLWSNKLLEQIRSLDINVFPFLDIKVHSSLLKLKSTNIDQYYSISSEIGIPQINTDKLQNNLFGIECNLNELNGIDFKKGCYVGQENTARIKLKDKLSKRLFPVEVIDGDLNKEKIINCDNSELGKVLINNKYPFAVIKFKDKKFKFDKIYKCGDASIKIKKPSWFK